MNQFEGEIPILGVCLGFQFIYEYYGGTIIHGLKPVHGHTTTLTHRELDYLKDYLNRLK